MKRGQRVYLCWGVLLLLVGLAVLWPAVARAGVTGTPVALAPGVQVHPAAAGTCVASPPYPTATPTLGGVFCFRNGPFGPSSQGNCDGVAIITDSDCLPGLHYYEFLADYYLGWAAHEYLASAVSILTSTPDLTSLSTNAGTPLGDLYAQLMTIAESLAGAFIFITLIRYFLINVGSGDAVAHFGGAWRALIGIGMLQMLPLLMPIWFSAVRTLGQLLLCSAGTGPGGSCPSSFPLFPAEWLDDGNMTLYYLNVDNPHPYYGNGAPFIANQDTWWTTMFGLVVVLMFFFLLLCVFIRIAGIFTLIALYMAAPLCVVTWITPEFSGIARWWFGSFVTYSLWGAAYAICLRTIGAIVAMTVGDPAGNPFLPAGAYSGDQVDFVTLLLVTAGLITMVRLPELLEGVIGAVSTQVNGVRAMRAMVLGG